MLAVQVARFNFIKIHKKQVSHAAAGQHHGNIGTEAAKAGDAHAGFGKLSKTSRPWRSMST